jgi:putative endopeptidase
MNARTSAAIAACLLAAACAASAPAPAPRSSGIDPANLDPATRPQDDLYEHANGGFMASHPMPPDKAWYGVFIKVRDDTLAQLRIIVEGLQANPAAVHDDDSRKIRDLYASYMDEGRIEAQGVSPLSAELARVDALSGKEQVAELIAHFNQVGIDAPYRPQVHQDARNSTRYVVDLAQSGLGLPDRDYYLKEDDAKLAEMRSKYRAHVEKLLTLAGQGASAQRTGDIVALETALARAQWTRVENRDPVKRYNPVEVEKLASVAPGYDWKRYLAAADYDGKVGTIIVSQPSYLAGFAKLLDETPLETWKAYFRWRVVEAFSPYLSKAFVDESFDFNGHILRGIPQNRPRWERGLEMVQGSMGFALGRIYVDRYFPPQSKARMDALVKNLLAAYGGSIDGLEWMSPETKKEARAKLAKFTPKIAYPVKWRDYSRLRIDPSDLVGNLERAHRFEFERNVAKLGKPVDRDEWHMTPQTVNAYYNPEINEVVFPAAILQKPFFDPLADDAVNYGGIGAVIGHEISHGFDDSGSQYDGLGNLRNWWTRQDHENFDARTAALVAQYDAYSPIPGYHLNGKLTLGENIADNSGLAIAWKAYRLSLGGREPPVIDGLTGAQRFYMGWASVWGENMRDEEQIRRIKIDPHSPGRFRANGAASNQASFYEAFGVKEGDKMFLPPERRVTIW